MNIQELYNHYPKIDKIISLANESREHSPGIARICDFLTEFCADLISGPTALTLVEAPAPMIPTLEPAPAPIDFQSQLLGLLQDQKNLIAGLTTQLAEARRQSAPEQKPTIEVQG